MRRRGGFTLAECMIALLFISIGLFAYVSLHIRLIHSGLKLDERETHHGRVSKKIGAALFGEYPVPPQPKWLPFDYLPGVEITKIPPSPSSLALPEGVLYYQTLEEWKDRNGTQSILVDTCKAEKVFVGW